MSLPILMQLSDNNVKDLQIIYKKQFDKDLSYEEAVWLGGRLIGLIKAVIGHVHL